MVAALTLEENERNYFPKGKIARVVCAGKDGTRKIITGIDGHTVHDQTLRARRLMEIVPGHGEALYVVFFCDNARYDRLRTLQPRCPGMTDFLI